MADEKSAAGVDPREEGRSPLDVIEGVAFIGGDANVAQVGEVAPGVHRGSPRGIVLDTLKVLGALVVALVAAVASMFRGEDPGADAWVAVGTIVLAIVVALVAAVVSWRTRTWELAEDGLALRSGVVVRSQRRIPYQRVHSVDLSSSVLERVLGLVSVKVDTGAGEVGEGNTVKHLRREDAEALKRALFARRVVVEKGIAAERAVRADGAAVSASEAPASVSGSPLPDAPRPSEVGPSADAGTSAGDPAGDVAYEMRLPNRLHVLAAVTDFNAGAALLSLFLAAVGIFQFADDIFGDYIYELVGDAVGGALGGAAGQLAVMGVAAFLPIALAGVAMGLVSMAVVTWVVSTILAYIRWGGFVLRRRGERIEVSSGLLSRSTRAVELNRVQSVSIDQSPLRRAAGYVQVAVRTVSTVGGSDSSEAANRERVVVHPCIPRAEAAAFVAQVLPEFSSVVSVPVEELGLHRLPAAALRRTLLRGVYWTAFFAVLSGVLTWLVGWVDFADSTVTAAASAGAAFAWASTAVGCVLMFVVRVLAWRIRRIGVSGPTLATVDGGVSRSTTYIARTKLQSLTRSVSPFQARAGVASVTTRTACTSQDGDPKMRDVAASVVEEIMAWVRPHYDNAEQAQEALREAGLA